MATFDGNGHYAGGSAVFRDITKRKKAEQTLKQREVELDIKNMSLEEMNAALRVLLKRRDEDKIEIEDKVLLNVRELVNLYLEKLKSILLWEFLCYNYLHINDYPSVISHNRIQEALLWRDLMKWSLSVAVITIEPLTRKYGEPLRWEVQAL